MRSLLTKIQPALIVVALMALALAPVAALPPVASSQTALTLADFDATNLETEVLALVESGAGDGGITVYATGRFTDVGTLVDGELDLTSGSQSITRIRFRDTVFGSTRDAHYIAFNDDSQSFHLEDYFDTDGDGNDLTLWIQTGTGTADITSFLVSATVDPHHNPRYVAFDVPVASQSLINGIADGDQFIIALTRPAATASVPSAPAAPTLTAANTSITATWIAPADGGSAITSYDVRHRPTSSATWTDVSDVTTTTTTISSLASGTEHEVQVRATNGVGDSSYSPSATITTTAVTVTVPNNPAAPTLAALSTTSLRISWAAPNNGGSAITLYELNYRADSLSSWTIVTTTETSHDVTSASPGATYTARVAARNAVGWSGYSPEGTGGTTAAAPSRPAAPTLTATNTTITATWTAPADGGSSISSYDVRYKSTSVASWTAVSDVTTTTTTISSLVSGTEYEVQVRATNGVGNSSYSPSATITTTTTASVPNAPAAPTLTATNTTIAATWSAPADGGSAITSYDVRYKPTSASTWTAVSDVAGTTTTISSLASGTEYEVQVRATNGVGDSGYSSSATVTTLAVPAAPAAPTLTATTTSITATWIAPADGGSAITSYDVRYKSTSVATWTAVSNVTSTTTTISGLASGTEYEVQVRATNSVGDSGYSTSATITTAIVTTVPSRPAAPTLTATHTTVTASWAAPNNGGSAITSYDVRYKSTSVATWTAVSDVTTTTTTISGLASGATYEVQVRATNGVGNSSYSPSATITTLAVPSTPAAPTLTATNTTITASWAAPNNGGSAITSYDVRYKSTSVATWTAVSDVTATTTTISSLASSTTYEVQVRATNGIGNSGYSTSATIATTAVTVTAPSTPAAPTLTATTTTITATWIAPANGGSAITSYDVRYRPTGNATWTNVSDVVATTTTISNLSPGTTYQVQVRATNSAGDSSYSTSGTGSTSAAAPSAPSAPTVTTASSTTLSVSWSAPVANGSTITSYDIRWRAQGGSSWTDISNIAGRSTTVTGLMGGTTYEVQVRATNGVGDSGYSASGTATTSVGAPSTPAAPDVTALTFTSVTVVWVAPANNGAPIADYDVRWRRQGTFSWTYINNIPATTTTISDLSMGATYDVQVRATNSAGNSSYSTTGSITIAVRAPASITELTASATSAQAGETVTLDGIVVPPNPATIVSYAWVSDSGGHFGDPTQFATTWTAPDTIIGAYSAALQLTITDSDGVVVTSSVVITLASWPVQVPLIINNEGSTLNNTLFVLDAPVGRLIAAGFLDTENSSAHSKRSRHAP